MSAETIKGKNLDWFITHHYYESESELSFIQEMMYEGHMNQWGDIVDTYGHIYQVKDWMSLIPYIGEDQETIDSLMKECEELLVQFNKELKAC